eukprot:14698139-Heterocapsa_arctica.AAC.1
MGAVLTARTACMGSVVRGSQIFAWSGDISHTRSNRRHRLAGRLLTGPAPSPGAPRCWAHATLGLRALAHQPERGHCRVPTLNVGDSGQP